MRAGVEDKVRFFDVSNLNQIQPIEDAPVTIGPEVKASAAETAMKRIRPFFEMKPGLLAGGVDDVIEVRRDAQFRAATGHFSGTPRSI
jgi:hypothetical protein